MPKIKGSVVFMQSSNYMSDSNFFLKLLLTFGTDKKVTGLFQAFHSHHHVFIKVNTDFSLISNAAFPISFPACYIRTRALEPIPVCVNRSWGKIMDSFQDCHWDYKVVCYINIHINTSGLKLEYAVCDCCSLPRPYCRLLFHSA